MSSIDFNLLNKFYYSNVDLYEGLITGDKALHSAFYSGINFSKGHVFTGIKPCFQEGFLNIKDSSMSINAGECAILKEYATHGNISVTRDAGSAKVDMLFLSPKGEVLSAYQFKNRLYDIPNIKRYLNYESSRSKQYLKVDTPFGEIDNMHYVIDIHSLPDSTKAKLWNALQSRQMPDHVSFWDTSIGVGPHNIRSHTLLEDISSGNRVISLLEQGEITGGQVIEVAQNIHEYVIYSHDSPIVERSIPILRSNNPIIFSVSESFTCLDLFFSYASLLVVTSCLIWSLCTVFAISCFVFSKVKSESNIIYTWYYFSFSNRVVRVVAIVCFFFFIFSFTIP